MKNFENLIRQLIRETLLSESQSPIARAADAGLALFTWSNNQRETEVIIYDPKILFKEVVDLEKRLGVKPYPNEIFRIISRSISKTCIVRSAISWYTKPEYDGTVAPCRDAGIVGYSVSANDGWTIGVRKMGPAAYEAAMWYVDSHSLASDRNTVSPSAEKVWNKYSQRADIEAMPFDDIEDPQTPDPNDDCFLHGSERPTLNNAYFLKSKPSGLDSLERKHEETLSVFETDYKISETEFTLVLRQLAKKLFEDNYVETD